MVTQISLPFRDEERRKREEDILSDDEFEKELNELGSDDEDGTFDDMNEDDLMMELEQMIDSWEWLTADWQARIIHNERLDE